MEFAKDKGQKIGTADEKIVSDLESREANTTLVLKTAVAKKNTMASNYLKQQGALNSTLKELRKFETGATGSATRSTSGATGSATGTETGSTGSATGTESGATGSATGTETSATGTETGPEDNIAATGIIDATAGEHSLTGFSAEISPLTLNEQQHQQMLNKNI
jgi:hypothetical protein